MKKEYATVFLPESHDTKDETLTKVLNTWAEDGYTLHSVVPYLDEGGTVGYTVIFELDIDDN